MAMHMTKRAKIIWGLLLVLLLGGTGGLWWMQQSPPPMPMPKPLPKKVPAAAKTPAAPAHSVVPTAPAAVPTPLTAGNLGRLTDLKGELEELELQVRIEELRAKKKTLLNPAPPAASLKMPDLSLPALTPPKAQASTLPPVLSQPAPHRAGVAVLSVQGVDGEVSAVVRTGSGTVTVRKGSRFGGGVVTSVSRQGVVVSRGGKTAALPFE